LDILSEKHITSRSTQTQNALFFCGTASLILPQKTITFWSGELGVGLHNNERLVYEYDFR